MDSEIIKGKSKSHNFIMKVICNNAVATLVKGYQRGSKGRGRKKYLYHAI